MLFDNLQREKGPSGKVVCAFFCPAYRNSPATVDVIVSPPVAKVDFLKFHVHCSHCSSRPQVILVLGVYLGAPDCRAPRLSAWRFSTPAHRSFNLSIFLTHTAEGLPGGTVLYELWPYRYLAGSFTWKVFIRLPGTQEGEFELRRANSRASRKNMQGGT
jgi:hypothetical protein